MGAECFTQMSLQKVLVTGSHGYVGLAVCKCASSYGFEVVRHRRSGLRRDGCELIWDMKSEIITSAELRGVDHVIHLAGIAHDTKKNSETLDYHRVNTAATAVLYEAACRGGVQSFTFVSTIKADPSLSPFSSPYAVSKVDAERILLDSAKKSGVRTNIVRPGLVYGPNPKGNLATMFRIAALPFAPTMPLLGNRKSLIHIDDLAHVLLSMVVDGVISGEIIVAAEEKPYDTADIYNAMVSVNGYGTPRIFSNFFLWALPKFARLAEKVSEDSFVESNLMTKLGYRTKNTINQIHWSEFDHR